MPPPHCWRKPVDETETDDLIWRAVMALERIADALEARADDEPEAESDDGALNPRVGRVGG